MRYLNPHTPSTLLIFLQLYRLFSGYGERFLPPLFWLAVLFIGSTLVYLSYELSPTEQYQDFPTLALLDTSTWPFAALYSLQVMLLLRLQHFVLADFTVNVIYMLQSLLGPLLLALFALAVRQHLKR